MYPNFSEFGLYRYDSRNKQRNRSSRCFSSIIVYGILAMTIIFGGLFYVFVNGRVDETTSSSNTFNKTRILNSTIQHVESNRTNTNLGLEVIEVSGKNYTESHAKRIKRLDSEDASSNMSPETQKLTFYQTRSLKPPRIVQKPKVIHYPSLPPNHKISARRMDPRVYQYGTMQPKPHEFLRPPTPGSLYGNQVHNIQDIHNQNHQYQQHNYYPLVGAQQVLTTAKDMMGSKPVQLTGSYRHPRTDKNLAQLFQQSKPQTLKAEASDPFQNYRPISPFEVNQMLNQHTHDEHVKYMSTTSETPYFRRKFKKKIASINNYNVHANEAANIYGNGNGMQTIKKRVQDRNEIQHQGKPFSVMLDVYPVPGEDNEYGQPYIHVPNLRRLKPIMNRYYQDPQMFNSMNFPQVMARYPAYFRYQNNQKQHTQPQQSSASFGAIQANGMTKPSQLVVHLNLYPKNNPPTYKRSSAEEFAAGHETKNNFHRQSKFHLNNIKNQSIDVSSTPFNINFNVNTGNGHPENIAHQKLIEFNRTSTEATLPNNNYFYDDDDEDEDINTEQSVNAHPSIVYKDIYRDKPIHLMLKNTTAATKRLKSNKNNNNDDHNYNNNNSSANKPKKTKTIKFHYQTLNRPTTKYANVIRPKSTHGPFFK
ncbi:putative uncharacterized protein DDB_G0290989 [Chironomus tepperi]|uniref:putative uncharacterized protein DDB_G0290989 n=1 Tax=Chironomus tepperi TaxID=113505 RepID=UPI00391EFB1C